MMRSTTQHMAAVLAFMLAVLAAGPAYAEWVLVSTGASGDGAADVLSKLGNRTGAMIDGALQAGVEPLSVRMLDLDVSRVGHG